MSFGWISRAILVSLLALGVAVFAAVLLRVAAEAEETRVVFLAVGQGDAILIQSGMRQILIDGGRDGATLLSALGRELALFDRTIDAVIATHPDADHIGGLPAVFDRYRVEQFIETGAMRTTADAELLDRALERHAVKRDVPGRAGVTLDLGQGGRLTLLYPPALPLDPALESNEGSIVARYEFGETSFLLTGDLPREELWLPTIAPVDVLKAAHHGSKSSTSDAWLDLVQPREVVLSVGDNNYGHPAQEVLERLGRRGITSWRTDRDGAIAYRCIATDRQCYRVE